MHTSAPATSHHARSLATAGHLLAAPDASQRGVAAAALWLLLGQVQGQVRLDLGEEVPVPSAAPSPSAPCQAGFAPTAKVVRWQVRQEGTGEDVGSFPAASGCPLGVWGWFCGFTAGATHLRAGLRSQVHVGQGLVHAQGQEDVEEGAQAQQLQALQQEVQRRIRAALQVLI